MVTLNERRFLQEAIDSVLGQTYSRWELLLVDDGSTDGSTEIALNAAAAQPAKVRYLAHDRHANLGMSASRNLGWRNAQGELLTFPDSDDVLLPRKLEHQVALLTEHGVDLVYGDVEMWCSWTGNPEDVERDQPRGLGEPVGVVVAPPGLSLHFYPLGAAPSPHAGGLLVRREVVEKVGGYEAEFRGTFEDQAFLAKLYLTATAYICGEINYRYRLHPDSAVSRWTRAGMLDPATPLFLEWQEDLLDREGVRDPAIRRALRHARRSYAFPRVTAARRRVHQLAAGAGQATWLRAVKISRAVRRAPTGTINASPCPCFSSNRFDTAATTLSWRTTGVRKVEIRVEAPDGPVMTSSGASGELRTGLWVTDNMRFYLQDATDGRSGTRAKTLDVVKVRVIPARTPGMFAPDEMPPGKVPALRRLSLPWSAPGATKPRLRAATATTRRTGG